ncbi:unnamed protein product [Rotaria magnacalcarata]|uniref:Uncharacterized protein n=2 Tax=Rotaria magnacalcarata TaxID=392030 RepID=A0A8S2PE47_9BILA|nr:unnamed protein product [Rotaria magnacalcarata]
MVATLLLIQGTRQYLLWFLIIASWNLVNAFPTTEEISPIKNSFEELRERYRRDAKNTITCDGSCTCQCSSTGAPQTSEVTSASTSTSTTSTSTTSTSTSTSISTTSTSTTSTSTSSTSTSTTSTSTSSTSTSTTSTSTSTTSTSTTTTTTTSTTTTRCPDVCWLQNCETGNRTAIPCPNANCTATTTTVASLQSDCSALQAELTRVKLGLGIGLGSGMAITSGLAAGSYIYFTRRLAQLSSTGFIGRKEFTSFC